MHKPEIVTIKYNNIGEVKDYIIDIINTRKSQADDSLKDGSLEKKEYDKISEILAVLKAQTTFCASLFNDIDNMKPVSWIYMQLISMFLQNPDLTYEFSKAICLSMQASLQSILEPTNGTVH